MPPIPSLSCLVGIVLTTDAMERDEIEVVSGMYLQLVDSRNIETKNDYMAHLPSTLLGTSSDWKSSTCTYIRLGQVVHRVTSRRIVTPTRQDFGWFDLEWCSQKEEKIKSMEV